jgi:hypothetical protein
VSRRPALRVARSAVAPALALVLALGLSSCGDDGDAGDPGPKTPDASETTDSSPAVTLTREGDSFTPNGERVELEVGQTLTLTVTADEAGELHVHSTPEQEIAYDAGTSEHEITIDRPGVVEVESHDPDVVVLQLEVR